MVGAPAMLTNQQAPNSGVFVRIFVASTIANSTIASIRQMSESSASQSRAHHLGERPPPLTDEEAEAVLFRQFRGWTFTEQQGIHRHWSWEYGWDGGGVEKESGC